MSWHDLMLVASFNGGTISSNDGVEMFALPLPQMKTSQPLMWVAIIDKAPPNRSNATSKMCSNTRSRLPQIRAMLD